MSEADYNAQLERLVEMQPDCLLLTKLRQGTSTVNDLLLAHALRKAKEAKREQPLELDESSDPVGDERLKLMRVEQRRLFSERARLSNLFHDCRTVEERAHNSEDIQVVQRNIMRVMRKIREYKVFGTISEENSKYYVPKDGLELAKKQNSLRANISRKQKDVKTLRETGNLNDPKVQRKIEAEEGKLTDLKMQLANIDEAIKNLH